MASPDKTKQHPCNLCGLPCGSPSSNPQQWSEQGLLDAHVCGGYDSTPGNGEGALDDMMEYRFSMCEFCLDWLFGKFQIPVTVRDYIAGETREPWRPAAQRVLEDDWRRMKEQFTAEYERRKKARERRVGNEKN